MEREVSSFWKEKGGLSKNEYIIRCKNLGISFGGLRAVNDFDLKIQKEELYGLIGPNGAGKTTVFNLLTGVYKPDSGKVLLDGKDLTGKKNIEISKGRNCKNIPEHPSFQRTDCS